MDISKVNVGNIFFKCFNHYLNVDPRQFTGACVKKNNLNAIKDGRIVICPIKQIEKGFVYTKLVNNLTNNDLLEDIRVPIFKNIISFVYLKYRPSRYRFSNTFTKVIKTRVSQIFTQKEQEKIIEFAKMINIEFGELDVLRDRYDGHIYILDANDTPVGPPEQLPRKDHYLIIKEFSLIFNDLFLT